MLTIGLVQQGAWDMPLESMPLAAAYLKAVVESTPALSDECDVTLYNFRGGAALTVMARELFSGRVPDVLAFSVLGWNYRKFGCLAETFKQLNPSGLVVFGGNHVANQSARVFAELPQVDVVVNGEGEVTFAGLVEYLLLNPGELDPAGVHGVSFRTGANTIRTTEPADRIANLDTIPSPFLTGAISMRRPDGQFRYDVALMETNRGCPYKCSFCYWGGAVGQRVRSFSRQRLAEELDFKTRERYGYPRALETSWAKNKSARFHHIVQDLQRHGFKSSFTLALQTLSDEALGDMNRKNMKVNQWERLTDWLASQGLDCYAELIWGAPGETPQSFLDGYDRLAARVSRIAVYPLMLLPNTSYTECRDKHGFVTLRGESDDFEYVLGSRSATFTEHLQMQRFMLWARLAGENQFLRHVWRPAINLTGMTQSALILSLMQWFDDSAEAVARAFCAAIPVIAESPAVARLLRLLYGQPGLEETIQAWWRCAVVPLFSQTWRSFATELYTYERLTRPVYVDPQQSLPDGWRIERDGDDTWYLTEPIRFSYDIRRLLEDGVQHWAEPPRPAEAWYVFRARPGFYDHMDNHETAAHYAAEVVPVQPPVTPRAPGR
jgi:radical SAM superfamily enzyme YgiQ (UPF0313 family)